MSNKSIRKKARKNVKKYYWSSLIVSFIMLILVNGGYNYYTVIEKPIKELGHTILIEKNIFIYDKIDKTFDRIEQKTKTYHPTKGVLSVFFNQIIGSGYIILGIINTLLIFMTHTSLPNLVIELLGILLVMLLYIFIQNVISVGKNRYYLEHYKYKKSYIDKLFFVYRVKKTINVSYIMLLKTIYNVLWYLTIFGGIYKYYEYFMIPYILAENPKIKPKDAFLLSKDMMNGNKLNLLKTQILLLPYYIVGILTFNLSNIFYFNIYKESLYAGIYFNIREKLLKKNVNYREYFKDELLDKGNLNESYPSDLYFIKEPKKNKWLRLDYNVKYSLEILILLFFSCALIGFIWEVLLNYIVNGFYMKKGSMHGPWIPIYGYGALAILILLGKLKDKPLKLFLSSIGLCGIIEYFTGWYLEVFHHMKWWDYTDYFLNIKGRICLEGLLIFGIAGIIFVYVLAPLLNNIFNKLSKKTRWIIASILVGLYLIDLVLSTITPNIEAGITLFKILRL